jgi:Domain of unknown function (DUF4399)
MTRAFTRRFVLAATSLAVLWRPAMAGPNPAPRDAELYFISPRDGQKLRGPVVVRFGLRGMGVAPAGVRTPNTGHHHVLVDVTDPVDPDVPVPQDKKHLHFGAGQTEARIDLPPGPHVLQLVLGDADHIPFDPPLVSKKIRITVLAALS